MKRLIDLSALFLTIAASVYGQAALAPMPVFAPLDNNGLPLNGGRLCTYTAGTSTRLDSYTDSSGSTPNSWPVVLDAFGRANVWLSTSSLYKLVLQGPAGTTCPSGPVLWTVDNVGGIGGGGGGGSFLPLSGGTMTGAILASGGQNLGDPTHAFGTLYANNGIYMGANQVIFPDTSATVKNLTITGTCTGCGSGGGGGGANTALSNLTTTAIAQSLVPATTNTSDLGSSLKVWNNAYVNNLTINGTCSGAACPGGGGGTGANTALSNLNTTSINQSLVPQTNGTFDLGFGTTLMWNNVRALSSLLGAPGVANGVVSLYGFASGTPFSFLATLGGIIIGEAGSASTITPYPNTALGNSSSPFSAVYSQAGTFQNLVVNGTCSGTAFPTGCGGAGGGGVGPFRAIQYTNGSGGLQGTGNGLIDGSGNLTFAGFGVGRNFTACGGSALTCSAGNFGVNLYNPTVTTIVAWGGSEAGLLGAGEWVAGKADGTIGASIDGRNGIFTNLNYFAGSLAGVTGATCTVFTMGICTHL
jgi:hypothetical protein